MKRRNNKRHAANFIRAYGSEARVKWVKGLGCVVCGRKPADNAHLPSRSGMGRKGDSCHIVPLCPASFLWSGHHAELDSIGVEAFDAKYRVNLRQVAAVLDVLWTQIEGSE